MSISYKYGPHRENVHLKVIFLLPLQSFLFLCDDFCRSTILKPMRKRHLRIGDDPIFLMSIQEIADIHGKSISWVNYQINRVYAKMLTKMFPELFANKSQMVKMKAAIDYHMQMDELLADYFEKNGKKLPSR